MGERDRERGDAARELLREFLADGPHHYGVVVAAAEEIGISEAELHHAMADLCMGSLRPYLDREAVEWPASRPAT